MDRNMRSNYINSGPRSLPHMNGSKRHINPARLSPPAAVPSNGNGNGNSNSNTSSHNASHSQSNISQHEDLVNYVYDNWNKVTRDLERGNDETKYYQEAVPPRQLANFRAFNLEEWWGRRLMQAKNRNKNRS